MSTTIPQVWQMAAGEAGRFYSDLFLKHDVMFLGPGKFGSYDANSYRRAVDQGLAGRGIVGSIANFYHKVSPGEIVLMRNGHQVKAIGVVADEDYQWNEAFDDVYGWDLQHTRRVIWQEHLTEALDQIQVKKPLFYRYIQIPTFNRVNDENVLAPLRDRGLFSMFKERPLSPLPESLPPVLSLDEVGQQLFARGIANDAVDKVVGALERQRRLLRWYRQFGVDSNRPSEHEVVAHSVLPILIALGWSEQLLAVEWKRIDLAVFLATPTTEENCALVCEAKTRNHGLQDAWKQAYAYVNKLKLNFCGKVLLTDGGRFYLYERELGHKGSWSDKAVGYLNVEKIRTNHIAPSDTNAIDTIVALTPAACGRRTK